MANSELKEKFYMYLCSGSCILIVVLSFFLISLFPSAFLFHNPLIPIFFFIIIATVVYSPLIIVVYFKRFHKKIKITRVDFYKFRKEKEGIKYRFLHRQEIAKIKKIILNVGIKYDRLMIKEISEMIGIQNEHLIIDTIKNMIEKKEIYAEFFSITNSVVFNLHTNIKEIDDLMEIYNKWEQSAIGKI